MDAPDGSVWLYSPRDRSSRFEREMLFVVLKVELRYHRAYFDLETGELKYFTDSSRMNELSTRLA